MRSAYDPDGISSQHDDLRHTAASLLVMAGVDLATVMALLGHKTIEVTMRYSHLAPAHKAAAVEKLAAALDAGRVAMPEPQRAAVGGAPALREATADRATPERSRHVFSGRQSPAKREYLQSQPVNEWRRGESNPRPKVRP